MLYHPDYDSLAQREELRRWEEVHTQEVHGTAREFSANPRFDVAGGMHANDPTPDRPLRVGYVSPCFRDHIVGRHVWPLLNRHDHAEFAISLYADVGKRDDLTDKMRMSADHWCTITGLPDHQVAERIRCDGIDVLVDLNLHMTGGRLAVFAQKPAPVQVTFAGYPGSTGLDAIDYRLTDPHLDPLGMHDEWYAEASYRLPHSFWCYDPQTEQPDVGPLPAEEAGFVTFGCLNNFCKVNKEVLAVWAQVMAQVPRSRLVLLAKQGSHRQQTIDCLEARGIAPERITFCSSRPFLEYLALYQQLDIALDTFPYNGHATSLDAFWMGVPVVTLVGNTVVGRAGLSQLANLDLPELAAATPDAFVRTAVALAHDVPRLKSLRQGLRQRMQRSPLMNSAGFTQGVEQAYRHMWRNWCGEGRVAGAGRAKNKP